MHEHELLEYSYLLRKYVKGRKIQKLHCTSACVFLCLTDVA